MPACIYRLYWSIYRHTLAACRWHKQISFSRHLSLSLSLSSSSSFTHNFTSAVSTFLAGDAVIAGKEKEVKIRLIGLVVQWLQLECAVTLSICKVFYHRVIDNQQKSCHTSLFFPILLLVVDSIWKNFSQVFCSAFTITEVCLVMNLN